MEIVNVNLKVSTAKQDFWFSHFTAFICKSFALFIQSKKEN